MPNLPVGYAIFRSLDLDETEEQVNAGGTTLYGWDIHNTSAGARYIKVYDSTAALVVVGTTTPVMTIPLAAGAAKSAEFTGGITFGTGLTLACVEEVADNGTTGAGANEVLVNVFYLNTARRQGA